MGWGLNLQQQEMRRALMKTSISGNSSKESKGVEEEDNVVLA